MLTAVEQRESMFAVQQAARQLKRKGVQGALVVWAHATATVKGRTIVDGDLMRVQVQHDGSNTGGIALFWNGYVDDTDEADVARMKSMNLYGRVDHRWQKIKFVPPNTLYIEDTGEDYVYDITLTFDDASGSSPQRP